MKKKLKKRLVSIIPYAIILAIDFYLLPRLIIDTGVGMFMMLYVMPLIALLCSVIYGVRQGFNLLLPVTAMILFVPSMFIYFNETAWVYVIVYGIVTLVGNGIGKVLLLFHKTVNDKSR